MNTIELAGWVFGLLAFDFGAWVSMCLSFSYSPGREDWTRPLPLGWSRSVFLPRALLIVAASVFLAWNSVPTAMGGMLLATYVVFSIAIFVKTLSRFWGAQGS